MPPGPLTTVLLAWACADSSLAQVAAPSGTRGAVVVVVAPGCCAWRVRPGSTWRMELASSLRVATTRAPCSSGTVVVVVVVVVVVAAAMSHRPMAAQICVVAGQAGGRVTRDCQNVRDV